MTITDAIKELEESKITLYQSLQVMRPLIWQLWH